MIPILLSLGQTLIGPLITAAESLFGPKTGKTKAAMVFDALKPTLEKMATAGKIPGIPSDDEISAAIEMVLANKKAHFEQLLSSVAPDGHQLLIVPNGARVVSIQFSDPKE